MGELLEWTNQSVIEQRREYTRGTPLRKPAREGFGNLTLLAGRGPRLDMRVIVPFFEVVKNEVSVTVLTMGEGVEGVNVKNLRDKGWVSEERGQ